MNFKLDLQGKNTEDAVRLFIEEIEPAEQEKTDLETAIELIEGLRDSITVLSCYWAEFVGFDFALKVLRFLAKHKPEKWQEYLDEMEDNYE